MRSWIIRTHAAVLGLATLAVVSLAHAAVVTRGPYLQMPTPSSMIVRWRTDVATDSRVSYGPAPGSLGTNVDDGTLTTEHLVTVSVPAANTQYYYAVGATAGVLAGDDADHFFRTPPVTGPAHPMRIWVTGDGGYANANGFAVRDAYATFNGGSTADLWLLLGDNAYALGTDAEYQAALFDMHHDMLRNTPVWSTFGNHEDFSSDDIAQTGPYFDMFSFPTAAQSGGIPSGTEAYYAFDYANVHFIVLDSEGPAAGPGKPSITDPMMVWLVADLQATTADWVIALWHRPSYSKGLLHNSDVEGNEINMRQNVLPTLEQYGVDLILNGHSHNYERSYLLDNHYGLSTTLQPVNKLDSGDGDPAGDGPYRKAAVGKIPHSGEVHAVVGSSSEVRPTTLNHPAHVVGLLELGSLVLDIDGDTLTGRFLNSSLNVSDQFQIVKSACPPAAQPSCAAAPKGKLGLKNNADDTKDTLTWTWRGGAITSSQVGNPAAQAHLALCLYDATGRLLGGNFPKNALWSTNGKGDLAYKDKAIAHLGFQKAKIKFAKPQIAFAGKGAGLGMPTLPLTTPVTTQLIQLDSGTCWESIFTTTKKNEASKFSASIP